MNLDLIKLELKTLPFVVLLGLSIALLIIVSYVDLRFDSFDQQEIIEKLKPEYRDLDIYASDETMDFKIRNPILGLRMLILDFIVVVTDEEILEANGCTLKELLCHEICHYKWANSMTKEEKEIWEKEYKEVENYFKDTWVKNPNEYHSLWCESHLDECFMEEIR